MTRAAGRWLALAVLLFNAACAPRLMPAEAEVAADAGASGANNAAAPQIANDRFVTPDGTVLPLRAWRPQGAPRAAVIAVHGFNDYSNAFASPGTIMAEHGIVTYAYDQRGFGAAPGTGYWAGADVLAGDFAALVRLVKERHPGVPVYGLGESMGGAVIMLARHGADPPPLDGVILSAPAVWGRSTMNPLQAGILWLAAHSVPWMRLSARGLDITPSDNIEMLRALGRDPLVIKRTRVDAIYGLVGLMDRALAKGADLGVPTLLLYGMRDEIIPRPPVQQLVDALPTDADIRVVYYPNGYHMLLRDLQGPVVTRDIVAWIADHKAPLPSGADREGQGYTVTGGYTSAHNR